MTKTVVSKDRDRKKDKGTIINPSETMHKYLRQNKKFPHVWCSGCGIGSVMGSIIRGIHKLDLDPDRVVVVSGIGCSSRMPIYLDFNTLHTTHGRAIPFSTGIKLARPELEVIVITGDGDAGAIGGNHLIHAARRNINLTVICINNNIYGMTGGQASPTTPTGARATTAHYGSIEAPFDLSELAMAAGASFVARTTTFHARVGEKLVAQAIKKQGFSFLEIMSQCPTYFGRMNKYKTVVDMLKWQKESSISVKKAKVVKENQKEEDPDPFEGKFLTGVLIDRDIPEYTAEYEKLVERVSK